VTYVATSALDGAGGQDAEWAERIAAHQRRRPDSWTTVEVGAEPSRLASLLVEAKPDEALLVDDLGGWVTALLGLGEGEQVPESTDDFVAATAALVAAVRDCTARLVLVSPEVGLSVVPATATGQLFTDFLGATNRAVADACDAVVLVVAGQPAWLKRAGVPVAAEPPAGVPVAAEPLGGVAAAPEPAVAPTEPAAGPTEAPAGPTEPSAGPGEAPAAGPAEPGMEIPSPDVITPAVAVVSAPPASDALTAPTTTLPMIATGLVIQPGMDLPLPDEGAPAAAQDRMVGLDIAGSGFGSLAEAVSFAAGVQSRPVPAPWTSVRVLLLHGDHEGGAAAGTSAADSARRADQAQAGEGVLATLAARAGASLQVVHAATAAPIEHGPALAPEAAEAALRYGWRLAEEAVDSGVDLIVLGSCGAGADTAAAAVVAADTGIEPAALLARVITPGGGIDDNAWMIRCGTVRDALHRIRMSSRGPRELLAELGGGDIALATGILLGATARRTPVLLDGPVGVAAGLVARDFAGQTRHWCLLPDHGQHPTVKQAAEILGLDPVLDVRLDLGEGANALAVLPVLQAMLGLVTTAPTHPAMAEPAGD
jgi:adenosyl cobinamide kinase/adenosyl cobinamide phosphate guanylyltransferase/NaMN:DMB phosphoribosyltransferase